MTIKRAVKYALVAWVIWLCVAGDGEGIRHKISIVFAFVVYFNWFFPKTFDKVVEKISNKLREW